MIFATSSNVYGVTGSLSLINLFVVILLYMSGKRVVNISVVGEKGKKKLIFKFFSIILHNQIIITMTVIV